MSEQRLPLGAALSALLVWAALPGHGLWSIACFAYVPLALAVRDQGPRRAACAGLLCGLLLQMAMADGLRVAARDLFGISPIAAAAIYFVWCLVEGARVALLAWLQARLSAARVALPLAFLLAFLAAEVLWPALFPVPLASVATSAPALLQVAELGGEVAVSLTLGAANASCLALYSVFTQGRPARLASLLHPLAYASVLALSALYGILRMHALDTETRLAPLSVAIVQAKGGEREPWAGLARYAQLTSELVAQAAPDLVVWSEAVVTKAVDERLAADFFEPRLTRKLKVPLVFGAALLQHGAPRETFFNAALVADRSGRLLGRYDKRVLIPFAEYVPLVDQWPWLRTRLPAISEYAVGERSPRLDVEGIRLTVLICYETIWPSYVREAFRAGETDVLVNLTNDRWFGRSNVAELHLRLAVLRAVEHRRHVLRGADTGVSAVIDPVGRIVARGELFEETTLRAQVSPSRARTLFARIGNLPWQVVAVAIVCFAMRRRRPGQA